MDAALLTSYEMLCVERRIGVPEHRQLHANLFNNSHVNWTGGVLNETLERIVGVLFIRPN